MSLIYSVNSKAMTWYVKLLCAYLHFMYVDFSALVTFGLKNLTQFWDY